MTITNGYATLAEVKERYVQQQSYTAATLSFDSSAKKISDTAYGLKRFQAGDVVQISGATNAGNNGFFTVTTGNQAGYIVTSEALTSEVAGNSITIAEVQLPEFDPAMESVIEAVSRWIDNYCGRTFYARTETRKYNVPTDANSRRTLWLDDDLQSITTLTNGDAEVLTTADYCLQPANSTPKWAVTIKQASSKYWAQDSSGNTEQVISIAGSWGYSTSAPKPVKEACILESIRLFKRRDAPYGIMGMSPAGGEVVHNIKPDPMIEKLLLPYMRLV
jgi:hypothetical protein